MKWRDVFTPALPAASPRSPRSQLAHAERVPACSVPRACAARSCCARSLCLGTASMPSSVWWPVAREQNEEAGRAARTLPHRRAPRSCRSRSRRRTAAVERASARRHGRRAAVGVASSRPASAAPAALVAAPNEQRGGVVRLLVQPARHLGRARALVEAFEAVARLAELRARRARAQAASRKPL